MAFGKKLDPTPQPAAAGAPQNAAASAAPEVDVDALRRKAKPPSSAAPSWVGQSPEQVCPGVVYESVEVFKTKDLIGRELLITGYSMRTGDQGEFAVISCVPTSTRRVAVFTCGGSIVLRKLKAAAEAKTFPILGKITYEEGSNGFNYYDLVDVK